MNYKLVGRVISQILLYEAIFMLPSLALSFYDGEMMSAHAFGVSIIIALAISGALFLLCRKAGGGFYVREGTVCVGLAWVVMSLLGCLPFCISGEIPSFIDAFFEIVSGFTTTGASVVSDVEGLSRGILYWRSFSHWVGGMGVLVFLLAIAPSQGKDGGSNLHLLRAESPGPEVSKLVPKMKQTATILYLIYIGLTLVNIAFLLFGGMAVFDSVCIAFGTAGTGGFGIRSDSIAGYSPYLQNVCTVFMLLFGVNFYCYHLVLLGKFRSVLRNTELKVYIAIFVVSTSSIFANLMLNNASGAFGGFQKVLRDSAFQVSSIMTTTGYTTADFDAWPSFSKAVLLVLMMCGACAGSTGGGIKCARLILYFKSVGRSIRCSLHPSKVEVIKNDSMPVDEKVIVNTNIYLTAYMIITVVSFLIVSIDGFSISTNISAVAACLNNIGPGFDAVGPTQNFSILGPVSKLTLIFDMLAGRLEIFPILALFSGKTWKS